MNISEKLDFLMNLTGTKNSSLGKALSFDPSYISRIRSGNRGIPKNQPFTRPVAAYFAKNLKEGMQLDTASHIILGDTPLPTDKEALEQCLYEWLEDDHTSKLLGDPIENFISDMNLMLDNVASIPQINPSPLPDLEHLNIKKEDTNETAVPTTVYYGNNGKREGVKKFLSCLIAKNRPFNLFLYSDEEMSWLVENPEFAKQWAVMLYQLLKTGSHIQIIHTISRNFSEMMEAIRKWLPLYATGAIEPYYYPMMRDNIYHRSLFIADEHSALISTSVENHTEGMANFYIKDSAVIDSLKSEYNNYFKLCKPLMKTYSALKNKAELMNKLIEVEKTHGKYMVAHPVPGLWTMPDDLAKKISERSYNDAIISRISEMKNDIIDVLDNGGSITEFLTIPVSIVRDNKKINIPLSDIMSETDYYYLPEEFLYHLKVAKKVCDKYPNYNIVVTDDLPTSIIMMTHMESDTIIANSSAPTYAFVVSNQQFSTSFYEYMQRLENSEIQNVSPLDKYIALLEKELK